MLLSRIRQNSLKRKIEKELGKRRVNSDEKIVSIFILVDENSETNIEELISSKLDIDNEKIKKVTFIHKNDNKDIENQISVSKKQFSWFGRVKDEKISELIRFQFDLLINLTIDNLYLDYLTAASNATFKVGLSNSDDRLYDLMIDSDLRNISIFSEELKKYLKILNKI